MSALNLLTRFGLTKPIAAPPGGAGIWYATETYDSGNTAVSGGSVSAPAALAAGDLLLLTVYTDTGASATITPPPGFTEAVFHKQYNNGPLLGVYWKIAIGNETTLSWTLSLSTRAQRAHLRAYHPGTGLSYANPPVDDADYYVNNSSTQTHTTPSITASAGARLTHVWGVKGNHALTLPALDDPENQFSTRMALVTGDEVQASAGASTGATATTSSNTPTFTVCISIKAPT